MYDLRPLCGRVIAAVDHEAQRVRGTLGELALDSTGLHGMPIYCDKHAVQFQDSFSLVYNNSNRLLLFVSTPFSQLRSTARQYCTVHSADVD